MRGLYDFAFKTALAPFWLNAEDRYVVAFFRDGLVKLSKMAEFGID